MTFFKKHPFVFFLFLHFTVWSLIPLLRQALPMDSIEAIGWGLYCTLGTNKHPPLSGYLANLFYSSAGNLPYGIYALSQVCVLIGFIYIYRLAKEFLSKEKAMFAVMLLEGVIYYGYSAPEYNVNVVSLALWPVLGFYFYRALQTEKLIDWTLTGLFAGLNLFNKYTSAFLLLAMLCYLLVNPTARQKFKTFGPYWCALVCLMTVFPHIAWLYRYDFFVKDYFLGRAGHTSVFGHVLYPIKFVLAQTLFSAGSLVIYFLAQKGAKKEKTLQDKDKRQFLLIMGLLPLIFLLLPSLIFGSKLKSMWGFPTLYLIGVMLFAFFPFKLTKAVQKRLFISVYSLMFLMGLALTLVILFNKSDKFHLNAPAFGAKMEQIWNRQTNGKPFKYVAGDVWWGYNIALFAPSTPKAMIWADPNSNPWFDAKDYAVSGALVVAPSIDEYQNWKNKITGISEPMLLELEIKNKIGKIKRKQIYYGFYNVSGGQN